jgi:hypothetical protein
MQCNPVFLLLFACSNMSIAHSPSVYKKVGGDNLMLRRLLGHTTLEMTRIYTQALGFDDVFKRHVVASPVDRLVR